MPSKSKAQQMAMAIALHGKPKKGSAAERIKRSMNPEDMRDYAETRRKNLPYKVTEGDIPDAPDYLESLVKQFDKKQVEMGMSVEQEHNDGDHLDVSKRPLDTLKIVLAHLKEDPEYYTHLKAMEDKHGVNEDFSHETVDGIHRVYTKTKGVKTPKEVSAAQKFVGNKTNKKVRFQTHGNDGERHYMDFVEEGTTSIDPSLNYEKDSARAYTASQLRPTDYAQEDIDIDDPDPQYASSSRIRREGDAEEKKLKGKNLLWDEEEPDDDKEIEEERLGEEIIRMIRAMRGIK